ncbi:MAG: cytochrome ubiquinol oxidase subunit I [Anaeromyxobacteraceae bacterium]
MTAVDLSRLQFAVTMCFHFIFPPLTIGLGWMLCVAEWMAWRKDDAVYARIGLLFGRLFAITFAAGVATGVVMLFQLGTNWGPYSRFVADVIGAPLATEGFFAFFLESAFMGLYLFGRGRVSKGVHWLSLFLVTLAATTVSAFPIIAANSWQQTPAGYVVRNGRAEVTSVYEAVLNPSTLPRYFHVIVGALVSGAFIFAAVGAWHVLRDRESVVGRRALRLGVAWGLVCSFLEIMPFGHLHAQQVARTQPAKFAAIEGLYTSQTGAPLVIFGIPFAKPPPPELKAKIEIPGLLSYLAFGNVSAHVQGIQEFPVEDRPPLLLTFLTFHNMIALGNLFIALMALAAFRLFTGKLHGDRWLLKALVWAVPLPLVAIQLGWITAEVGRQPWIIYNVMRTGVAASPAVSAGHIALSLALFSIIYLGLLAAWLFLMIRQARGAPAAALGAAPGGPASDPVAQPVMPA